MSHCMLLLLFSNLFLSKLKEAVFVKCMFPRAHTDDNVQENEIKVIFVMFCQSILESLKCNAFDFYFLLALA